MLKSHLGHDLIFQPVSGILISATKQTNRKLMITITGFSLCSDWRQLHTRRFGQWCSAQSLCSDFFNRRHDQQSRRLSGNDIVHFHPDSWPLFWINGPPFCIDWTCLLTLLNTKSVNAVIFHWGLRDWFRAGLELKVKVVEYSVSVVACNSMISPAPPNSKQWFTTSFGGRCRKATGNLKFLQTLP